MSEPKLRSAATAARLSAIEAELVRQKRLLADLGDRLTREQLHAGLPEALRQVDHPDPIPGALERVMRIAFSWEYTYGDEITALRYKVFQLEQEREDLRIPAPEPDVRARLEFRQIADLNGDPLEFHPVRPEDENLEGFQVEMFSTATQWIHGQSVAGCIAFAIYCQKRKTLPPCTERVSYFSGAQQPRYVLMHYDLSPWRETHFGKRRRINEIHQLDEDLPDR